MQPISSSTVTAMVSDMDASIKFYTEVLGLKLKNNYGGHYAEIDAPGLIIGLHPGGKAGQKISGLSIGFMVTDFDEWVEALKQKGVTTNVINDGWSRLCTFTDLDGNEIYLSEKK
jgi:catechol 2,3-dioxygenase-like lactoylglutathione lyase family enzyme